MTINYDPLFHEIKQNYCVTLGDAIFYINFFDQNKIYKSNRDGSRQQKISDHPANCLFLVENWIYYYNTSDDSIYKMGTDGKDKKKVL